MDYKNDIGIMMRNENLVQVNGTAPNIGYHSSQKQQVRLDEKDNIGKLSSELCNISAEYIEAITKAHNNLRNYYTTLVMVQLNLLEKLSIAGFAKGDAQELFKQLTISTVQFWINVCTLPWKLALGNILCIKPLPPFQFSLQRER